MKQEKLLSELEFSKQVKYFSRKKRLTAVLLIFLIVAITFTGGVFFILNFVQENSMRITINRLSREALSLDINESFTSPNSVIDMPGPKVMDNTTYGDIDFNKIHSSDGSQNGAKFIAFTFYLKNAGKENSFYQAKCQYKDSTKQLDSTLRIMVIRNGEKQVYAKTRADGTPEFLANDKSILTTPFMGDGLAYESAPLSIAKGNIDKYSVILWIEGWDEDTVDAVLGGSITMSFSFEIVPNPNGNIM